MAQVLFQLAQAERRHFDSLWRVWLNTPAPKGLVSVLRYAVEYIVNTANSLVDGIHQASFIKLAKAMLVRPSASDVTHQLKTQMVQTVFQSNQVSVARTVILQ